MQTVTVTTASKLSKEQLQQVHSLVEKRVGKAKVEQVVDPAVIGGIRLTIGTQSFDATVEGKLERLETVQTKAKVTTAIPLTAAQRKKIAQALESKFGTSEFDEVVDPAVIGGIKLIIGSEELDGTVAGKLDKLKQHILKNL
jgi:F0F1-type ATP synthase delta subunit